MTLSIHYPSRFNNPDFYPYYSYQTPLQETTRHSINHSGNVAMYSGGNIAAKLLKPQRDFKALPGTHTSIDSGPYWSACKVLIKLESLESGYDVYLRPIKIPNCTLTGVVTKKKKKKSVAENL